MDHKGQISWKIISNSMGTCFLNFEQYLDIDEVTFFKTKFFEEEGLYYRTVNFDGDKEILGINKKLHNHNIKKNLIPPARSVCMYECMYV